MDGLCGRESLTADALPTGRTTRPRLRPKSAFKETLAPL